MESRCFPYRELVFLEGMADAADATSPAPLSFSLKLRFGHPRSIFSDVRRGNLLQLRIPCSPQGVAVSGDNAPRQGLDKYSRV